MQELPFTEIPAENSADYRNLSLIFDLCATDEMNKIFRVADFLKDHGSSSQVRKRDLDEASNTLNYVREIKLW